MAKGRKKVAAKTKSTSTRAGTTPARDRMPSAPAALGNGHLPQDSPKEPLIAPLPGMVPEISMRGFVKELRNIHDVHNSQSFVFLLGAGTSVSSGIPGAQKLAQAWLEELHVQDTRYAAIPFHQWMHDKRHGIANLNPKNIAASYPDIFDRRFASNRNLGYAVLTSLMKDAQPGYGYSVLATMLATSRHKAVITTNFDSLVERALLYYTNETPLTCTHETTAGGFRKTLARPLIVKCHRDLLLDPHSGRRQVSKLHENYGRALGSLLPGKVLVVIGYGGNDGSLMGYLKRLAPEQAPEAVYWCYWEPGGPPDANVCAWIAKNHGQLVPIPGFDELMAGIGGEFGYDLLEEAMEKQHRDRVRRYKEQVEQIVTKSPATNAVSATRTVEGPEAVADATDAATAEPIDRPVNESTASDAVNFASESIGKAATAGTRPQTPWESLLRIMSLSDSAEKDTAFRKALAEFPGNALINGDYALFLTNSPGRRDEAEPFFKRAVEADPKNVRILSNYALLLKGIPGRREDEETLYKRALEADPKYAPVLNNYALLLNDDPGRRDAAEILYKRAVEAAPNHAIVTGNYALYLERSPGRRDEAEPFYKRAIEADPKSARILNNYACFLKDTPGRREEAEAVYIRAIDADPQFAPALFNYANFLRDTQGRRDEADALYKRSIEADPTRAGIAGNYALFLERTPGRWEDAERFHKRAIEVDPTHANSLANYTRFLIAGGRIKEAAIMLGRAIKSLNPATPWALDGECWMYAYCIHAADQQLEALSRLKELIVAHSIRTGNWDFSEVIARATEAGHSEAEWLPKLADVLAGKAEPASLDVWTAWKTLGNRPRK